MKKTDSGNNRLFTVCLKGLRQIRYFWNRLKLSLEINDLGHGCKVLDGVIVSGGNNIRIGKNCFIGRNVLLDCQNGEILIGDNVEIRDGARLYARKISIGAKVTLGEGCLLNGYIDIQSGAWLARGCEIGGKVRVEKAILGPHVMCVGGAGHSRDPETDEILMSSPGAGSEHPGITISEGAWIGARSIILKNIHIEKKVVVGAGSVVTKSFPEKSVIAGNPAKPISSKLSVERP